MLNSTRRDLLLGGAAGLSLVTLGPVFAHETRVVRFLDIYLYRHRMVTSGALAPARDAAVAALNGAGLIDRARLIEVDHAISPNELIARASITGGRFGLGTCPDRPSGAAALVEKVRQRAEPRERPYAYVIVPQDIGPEIYIRSAALLAEPDNPYRPLLIRSTGSGADPLSRGFSPDPRDRLVEDVRSDAVPVTDGNATMLDAARLLLNHVDEGAEYVFVASPGYRHESAAEHVKRAIGNVCRQCKPGGLDLDETIVVVHADVESPTPTTPARGLAVLLGSGVGRAGPGMLPLPRSSVATRQQAPLTDPA